MKPTENTAAPCTSTATAMKLTENTAAPVLVQVSAFSSGVPFGWRLLKGKQARRFLEQSLKEELRYQRDRKARQKAGGKLTL